MSEHIVTVVNGVPGATFTTGLAGRIRILEIIQEIAWAGSSNCTLSITAGDGATPGSTPVVGFVSPGSGGDTSGSWETPDAAPPDPLWSYGGAHLGVWREPFDTPRGNWLGSLDYGWGWVDVPAAFEFELTLALPVAGYDVTVLIDYDDGSDPPGEPDPEPEPPGPPFEPPVPAGVLLEIYAAAPGSARWGIAQWGIDTWAAAGWQDVTPYGVNVNITWGSSRPDRGILSVPDAASWAIDYYDPDRVLDPANASGPYYGDLLPFLPIRVSHRGTVIRQGFATGISHNYRPPVGAGVRSNGYMRGADNITRLANAKVPSDINLADTLYERAVDAIAAAGLQVTVMAPLGTDPPVTAWATGRDWTAWQWIMDAAQEVLHIPIIDRLGRLTFRPWAAPLARGRSLSSPELIDLAVVTDYAGLYSVVQAREDVDTVVERALTPPPRYGARTFTRDEDTLNPGAWADAVLADRSLPTLLWKPGELYPLTADSVERLATIEAVELVSVSLTEQSPAVFASGIVVGGEIDIRGKQGGEALWRFRYELAQTATEPLIESGGDPTDYLLATGGDQFLYPTGSA